MTRGRRESSKNPFSLEGKVAVISGSSTGIGLAIANVFADAGATVVMTARGEETLREAAAQVAERTGARVEWVVSDISTVDGADLLADFVHERFAQADVLVNNAYAGGSETQGIDVLDIEDPIWVTTFQTNVLGPFRLIRRLGKPMRDGRGGSIINVLSGSGFLPGPGVTPYGTSKAALWMLTRYLATELAPSIRVNALVPGLTTTRSLDGLPQSTLEHYRRAIPMGREGHPDEVAPAALYLASDAASYTTGTVLFVNGGRPW